MSAFKALNFVVLLLAASLLASCGSENKTTQGSYSSGGSWTGSNGQVTGGTISSIISNIKSQTDSFRPCQGGSRLPDVHFPASVYSTNTLVSNQQSTISYPSSNVLQFYIGLSNFGDIMIVSKTSSGYYVTLSMCPYGSSLTTNRPIKAFHTPNGITLGDTTSSGMGTILAAKNTSVLLSSSSYYAESWFGPTTFFPVNVKP